MVDAPATSELVLARVDPLGTLMLHEQHSDRPCGRIRNDGRVAVNERR